MQPGGTTETVNKMASSASEMGRKAMDQIDQQKENAANKLETAAAKIHESVDASTQRISSMGHSAASGIQASADYLRSRDARQMINDVENLVRKYPGRALLIAAGVGFLTARALRTSD